MKKTNALESALAMRADLTRRLKRVNDFIATYRDFEREGWQPHYARKNRTGVHDAEKAEGTAPLSAE